jgi:hypothetical protein
MQTTHTQEDNWMCMHTLVGVHAQDLVCIRSAGHSPIRPYSASASAKMRIRIIPTNSLGC